MRSIVRGSFRGNLVESGRADKLLFGMIKHSAFRYIKTSPDIIRLAVMLYLRFPLSLRNGGTYFTSAG